jgi:hypothetical protein
MTPPRPPKGASPIALPAHLDHAAFTVSDGHCTVIPFPCNIRAGLPQLPNWIKTLGELAVLQALVCVSSRIPDEDNPVRHSPQRGVFSRFRGFFTLSGRTFPRKCSHLNDVVLLGESS